jgi:hypothetical protein
VAHHRRESVEDAKTEVIIGATGPAARYWLSSAAQLVLGTRFKIVTSYDGGNSVNL